MKDSTPYSSRCPKCHELRFMDGSSRDDLLRLLKSGDKIEGWCQPCDERWTLSEQERAGIAKG